MTHAVLDLAGKFADGTLSTKKLLEADDEELHKILTAVRGIGTVSVLLVVVGHERLIVINIPPASSYFLHFAP